MALLICPECGHKVSDRAEICPECGFPVSEMLANNNEEALENTEEINNLENDEKEQNEVIQSEETILESNEKTEVDLESEIEETGMEKVVERFSPISEEKTPEKSKIQNVKDQIRNSKYSSVIKIGIVSFVLLLFQMITHNDTIGVVLVIVFMVMGIVYIVKTILAFLKKGNVKDKGISLAIVVLAFLLSCVVFAASSTPDNLDKSFASDNLETVSVHTLSVQVPSDWSVKQDVTESEDSIARDNTIGEDKYVAGVTVKYLGSASEYTNSDGKIEEDTVLNRISDDATDISDKIKENYSLDGAEESYILSCTNTENNSTWKEYVGIVIADGDAFGMNLYVTNESEGSHAAETFFSNIDFANYESPRELTSIKADYSGARSAGTTIDSSSDDLEVTAYYDDGSSEKVTDFEMDSVTLKADKTSKLKISYGGQNCTINVTCSTVSAKKFKNSCTSYSYSQIAHHPDKYKGKKIKVYGKVLQVIDGTYTTAYRIAMNGDYDHVIYVEEEFGVDKDGEIIEDDYITIYGTCEGRYTYETVMGASVTIPSASAKYIKQ